MRRALLIAAFLLLAAPAATLAQERATVKLSSKPDKVPTGEPWHVVLTIKQPGRAARSDLKPVDRGPRRRRLLHHATAPRR